jgi:SAM-dependent methyltransferase
MSDALSHVPAPEARRRGYFARSAFFDTWFHLVMRAVDLLADSFYRIDTRLENRHGPDAPATRHGDAAMNMPSYYLRLFALRRALRLQATDVVTDLGCGTGRALFVLAAGGARTVRGIEFDPKLCSLARDNVRRFGGYTPIEIIEADAAIYRFSDETIVYFFNAFGPATLRSALAGLRVSLAENPRRVRIAYYHPKHRDVLDGCDWLRLSFTVRGFKTDIAVYETARA